MLSVRRKEVTLSNSTKKGRHLSLSERVYIEQALLAGLSLKEIGNSLRRDPSTIAKEVKKHRTPLHVYLTNKRCIHCKKYKECKVKKLCDRYRCTNYCKHCNKCDPTTLCRRFDRVTCKIDSNAPYVCIGCDRLYTCPLNHYEYSAIKAQKSYENTLSTSRKGIRLSEEELKNLDALITPLVKRGQPLNHIFAVHEDEIPCSRRSLYNYMDDCVFQARNIDLPRKVHYRRRHKKRRPGNPLRFDRTYLDFQKYIQENPNTEVIELDTVHGKSEAGKCLLTMLFRASSLMLIFLLPDCTQTSVLSVLNSLNEYISTDVFRKYIPVILTDNGAEFRNAHLIETSPNGEERTKVFYCDPYMSGQKGRLEHNHSYIRYVIPKGYSMEYLTQEDASLLASHINSVVRDSLNGNTPYQMAEMLLDKRILAYAGIKYVSPDDVLLRPELLEI